MTEAWSTNREGQPFPIRSHALPLPAGDAGTNLTVQLMLGHIKSQEGSQHAGVRAYALKAVQACRDRDDWQQAQAIYQAVKRDIRFRGEEGETVQSPWLTLQLGAGDCDDFTTLMSALLRSIGIPTQIQTILLRGGRTDCHVYAMVGIRQNGRITGWRALDATVPGVVPGWQPPDATRRKFWGGRELNRRGNAMPYTQQNDMGGFFHFISHAAFKGAKIGAAAGEGFITGGPEGALRGGATAALQRGPQHGSQNAQSPAATQQARAIAAARHTAEHRAAMQRRAARRAEEFRYGMSEYEFSQPLPARFAGGYPHVAGSCAPGIAHSSYGYGMGDASGGLPDWGSFSPTQKVLAGLAAAALLVVVTK